MGFIMDIVSYYTDLSKKELFKVKEINEFNLALESEMKKVSNLKFNRNIIKKIFHPITTIRTNNDYKRLKRIKDEFNYYVDSSVLMYDNSEFGELQNDLKSAATYYKPKFVKEYIKTIDLKQRKQINYKKL